MSIVLDSSIALAWNFEDEQTDDVRALLAQVAATGARAPSLWRFEVANGLHMAVRRGRIDAADREAALAGLMALDIRIDNACDSQVWSATVQLAELHDISLYGAAYLELAQRLKLPLATLDTALATAARAAGVEVRP